MSLKARFLAVMGLVLVLFAGSLFLLNELRRRSAAEFLQSTRHDRQQLLERVVTLIGSSLQTFATDYSLWDDMVAFAQNPRKDWAATNIDASLPTFNAVGAWVFRTDGTLAYAAANLPGSEPDIVSLFSTEDVVSITRYSKTPHFFVETPAGLLEVRGAPLQPSNDYGRQSPAQGWFFVARRWDDKFLSTIGHLNESEYRITRPNEEPDFAPNAFHLRLQHVLPDWNGQPCRTLHLDYNLGPLRRFLGASGSEVALFITYGVVTIALVVFALMHWVLRPLRLVSQSLAEENPGIVQPLVDQRDEFGRVARLVQTSADQRRSLQSMLAERARLGRDLHDSVIQTIYACGMGVMSARLTLRTDLTATERTLEQIGGQFNDVIQNLRGFITGLEPELLRHRTFREAMDAVVASFDAPHQGRIALEIDDAAPDRLTAHQQVNVLHIVRECISNALRHGLATEITVRLLIASGAATLDIVDNGRGFDPIEAPRSGGKGLANLAERAKDLAATLIVESAQGNPTRIRVTIPLSPPTHDAHLR